VAVVAADDATAPAKTDDRVQFGGHTYQVFADPVTWTEARD
jgi:hypothetical protein